MKHTRRASRPATAHFSGARLSIPLVGLLLIVGATPGLTPASFQPFIGHPSLTELHAYVGRTRDNEAIRRMFPEISQ